MSKTKIEPNIILTIYTHTYEAIQFIITDNECNTLYMDNISYNTFSTSPYQLRKQVLERVETIYNEYTFDTILLESTKLFTEGMTKYPDPNVYKNIVYSYGVQVAIEDNFMNKVNYILVIPFSEWTQVILNTKIKYILDKCKNHILMNTILKQGEKSILDKLNLYTALCFAESIKYDCLINKKYLIK